LGHDNGSGGGGRGGRSLAADSDADASKDQDRTNDEAWHSRELADARHHAAREGETAAYQADQEQDSTDGCEQYGKRRHFGSP
jgi:hypothetical protein